MFIVYQMTELENRMIALQQAQEKHAEAVSRLQSEVKLQARGVDSLVDVLRGAEVRPGAGSTAALTSSEARDPARNGGTFRSAYANDPSSIDPITATDTTSGDFRRLVCESLTDRPMSDPTRWEAVLATKWDISEDGKVITVELRREVNWHSFRLPDGTPVGARPFTAADVAFTFDVVMNPKVQAAHMRSYYEKLCSWEVLGSHTIRFHWKETYFKSLEQILGFEPIPRHLYSIDEKGEPLPGADDPRNSPEFAEAFNKHWSNKTVLVGTGPYLFSEYQRGKFVQKTLNPSYWGERPFLEGVRFLYVPDTTTRYDKFFSKNEIDSHSLKPPKYHQIRTGKKKEPRLDSENPTAKIELYDYPVYRYVGWNQRLPKFQDRRVRRALTMAIDRSFICRKLMYGTAKIQTGPFFQLGPASDPSVKPWPHDPEQSKALFREAGWTLGRDGVWEKTIAGKRYRMEFSLYIYADNPVYQRIAETIKEDFRRVGVEMDIAPLKWGLFLDKLNQFDFEAAMLGWGLDFMPDPNQLWHSRYADERHSSNFVGFRSEKADALIAKIQKTIDLEDRKVLYHQFHRHLHEEQPYTFLFFDRSIVAYDTRLQGVTYYGTGLRPCYDRREWWIAPRKRIQ